MNPSKSGISSATKTGILVVLVVLVLGGVYLGPTLSKGSGTQTTSSQPVMSCSGQGGGNQTVGLLTLFGCFSQMQVQESTSMSVRQGGSVSQETLEYVVLGTAPFNLTKHTKVEFSHVGGGGDVIAWFNSRGVIDRLDVIGAQNYTGPGAPFFASIYTAAFGAITQITNNATLLSILSKTSENTTSIGPTLLDVATYHLAVPTPQFKSITAKYATIPGTNQRLAIYLDEKTTDGSETIIQVLSVTK